MIPKIEKKNSIFKLQTNSYLEPKPIWIAEVSEEMMFLMNIFEFVEKAEQNKIKPKMREKLGLMWNLRRQIFR